MNSSSDNAALRLLKILRKGKSLGKGNKCRDMWHELLDVPGHDQARLMTRIGKTMALTGEIREAVLAVEPDKADSYLGWVPAVNKAFTSQSYDGQWATFINHINDNALHFLSNTADMLGFRESPEFMEVKGVEGVSSQLDEIIAEILISTIEDPLRGHLLRELRSLKIAVDEYWLTGSSPVIQVAESAVAHLAICEV